MKIANAQGRAVWLEEDELYIARQDLTTTVSASEQSRFSIYALNLNTNEETLLRKAVPSTNINGRQAVWIEQYPKMCRRMYDCSERFYSGCSLQVIALDLVTGEEKSLGIISRYAFISSVTPDLVVLNSTMGSCDIKSHSGPIQALDLESGEYRLLSSASVSPGPDYTVVGAVDRTVAYSIFPDHAIVLHIEPTGSAEVLVNSERTHARGLAGSSILLYSPVPPDSGRASPQKGLSAINLHNGYYQEVDSKTYVRWATGDEAHVAWVTVEGELFVAPLDLEPPQQSTILDTPMPTLEPIFLSPLPMPTWLPPTRSPYLPTVTPLPANQQYP